MNEGIRSVTRAAWLVALCVLLATPLAAQFQQQTRDLGFSAQNVYSTTDIDSVNLFNGNLVLTLPIGQTYPVSERLSYGLTLVHNSQVWTYVQLLDEDQQTTWVSASFRPSVRISTRASMGFSAAFSGRTQVSRIRSRTTSSTTA